MSHAIHVRHFFWSRIPKFFHTTFKHTHRANTSQPSTSPSTGWVGGWESKSGREDLTCDPEMATAQRCKAFWRLTGVLRELTWPRALLRQAHVHYATISSPCARFASLLQGCSTCLSYARNAHPGITLSYALVAPLSCSPPPSTPLGSTARSSPHAGALAHRFSSDVPREVDMEFSETSSTWHCNSLSGVP